MTGPIRYGVHSELEAEANRLIKESLAGVHSYTAKRDILTPWKEKDRRDHEVQVESGFPEAAIRSGMYHRALNTASEHLNSRDGVVRGRRINSSMYTFAVEHGGVWEPNE